MFLAIGAIVLSFGVASIGRALAQEELDGWVRAITFDLTAAQQAAMTRRASVTASFQNNRYTIVLNDGGTLSSHTLPSHISFGASLQTVTFDRRGVPSGAASITVKSTRSNRTYTITIEPNTGRVSQNG